MKVGILLTVSMSCNLDRSRYFFVILTDLVEPVNEKEDKRFCYHYCKRVDGDPVRNLTDSTTII